jgi:hypothetical protein
MAMQTDVKAASLSESGTAYAGPTRVKGLVIYTNADTVAEVVLRDGGETGTIRFSIPAPNAEGLMNIVIPGEGIRFTTDVYADLTSCEVVVFYG